VTVIRKLWALISWLPLIGGLQETSSRDHLEAVRELGLGQIIATMPIWGGALHIAWPNLSSEVFYNALRQMVNSGELFIYAATTLAPVLYIVSRERDIPRMFPNKYLYLGIIVVGAMVAAIIYTLQRTGLQPITDQTLSISFWFYLASLVVLYLAYVYNNTYLPNASQLMRKLEQEYTQRLREHR